MFILAFKKICALKLWMVDDMLKSSEASPAIGTCTGPSVLKEFRKRHVDKTQVLAKAAELFALIVDRQTPISVNLRSQRFVRVCRCTVAFEVRTTNKQRHSVRLDDPDVIHVDNSSDLALSTNDDIIDEEDPIPYDLADSDDEDLVNLDIDDGMSADVARGHGGDGGGDDRPPSHHIPTGCGGCLGNREWAPSQFRFKFGELGQTTFGELVGELSCTTLPGVHVRQSRLAGSWLSDWGPSLTCVPTWNPIAGHLSMRPSAASTKDDEMLRLQGLGSNTETGVPYTEDEIMAIVRGGKQRGHIPGVGRVVDKRESLWGAGGMMRQGDDEDDSEDGEDEDDS
ncbi:hypothetical protein Tco_1318547 [Tanacetum coccineum]